MDKNGMPLRAKTIYTLDRIELDKNITAQLTRLHGSWPTSRPRLVMSYLVAPSFVSNLPDN
ncbi:hypothetical protein, partial [Hyphomonas sp.]|uniref:hypothetical protein n=1 Tax=Hyphomonas sp. TaxID=87 RepID=UPI00329815F3